MVSTAAATASVLLTLKFGLLFIVLLALPPSVDAELASDPALYVTLSFLAQNGQQLQQNVNCAAIVDAFYTDLQVLNAAACTIPGGTLSAVAYNSSACTFTVRPPKQGDAMVPCFDAVVNAPWGARATWSNLRTALAAPTDVAITTLRISIGQFVHEDNEQGSGYRSALMIIGLVFVVIVTFHFLDAIGVRFADVWSSSRAQVISCLVVVAAILCGILLYLTDVLYKPTPLITASYPLKVDSCYITLEDVPPWDIQEAVDAITVAFAAVQFTSVSSTIASQWPCSSKVFYNPYHVLFDAHGDRIPLSISLTSSSLVVSSRLNATNVPLNVVSTPHQLKANRVYLSDASFYSVAINLFSGIGYVSNSVTDPSQIIEMNTTSVFVVTDQEANPKHVNVRHVSNPPLFCIGPHVQVVFNASACTGDEASADAGAASGGGSGSAGGNETYRGYSGTCRLEASDPVNASSPTVQNLKVQCVSFYALPSRPAPISNKTIGSGFETPPELSRPILQAINTSSDWASTALFDDYVQSIEIVTPLLGILMLNSNNPSILTFFPELLVWFTAFVLQPPFRTLQAVPNHFTCDDDLSIEGLVPPASTMITYLDNNVLLYPDERFAAKVLMPTFLAVDQQPNTLTTFQLPYEARKAFPGVHRNTIVDTTIEEVQRPLIADILIFISAILSFLLIAAVVIMICLSWGRLYAFFALASKESVVNSTLKRCQRSNLRGNEPKSAPSDVATTTGAKAGPSNEPDVATNHNNINADQKRKKSCKERFVAFLDRIEYPAEVIVRVVNGFSYRVVSMVTQRITGIWSGEHAALKCFIRTYTEIDGEENSVIILEEFNVLYRAYCNIFDRVDGQEYKNPNKLFETLQNVIKEDGLKLANEPTITSGVIRGIQFVKPLPSKSCWGCDTATNPSPSTLFEQHVRQVKMMFDDNNVNFSFISSRCFKGLHWYDRFVRHPFAISNAQIFVYCFVFLLPISFAMFSLFSLQMAQQPYQIYGVNFRTANTVGAFLPIAQVQPTMQFVLVWTFYVAFCSVMFERLIHSLNHALPRCDPNSDNALFALLRIPFLRFTFRLILSVVYLSCCMYSVGYIFMVALWWILTCFLAPNVMIPFAAASISLITSVWGVYQSLKGCKQKLSDQLNIWIQKEVSKFLEDVHFVVGDQGVAIVEETNGGDRTKFIASSTQLPLQVVAFALNSKDASCRREMVKLLAAPASPEFCDLLTFACGTATDVDDVTVVLQPFIDVLVGSGSGSGNVVDPMLEAQVGLLVALIKSVVLPQSDESRLNDDVIRSAALSLWQTTVNARIDDAAMDTTDPKRDGTLKGLRQIAAAIVVFLQGRRLDCFCRTLLNAWPRTFSDDASMNLWQQLLPVVGSLSWLLDDATPFQPTFDLLVRCFPTGSVDEYMAIYSAAEAILATPEQKPTETAAAETSAKTSKQSIWNNKKNPPNEMEQPLLEIDKATTQGKVIATGEATVTHGGATAAPGGVASTGKATAAPAANVIGIEDERMKKVFSEHEQLYKSLKISVATRSDWAFDPRDLESAGKEEEASLLQKWVRAMRLGKEWPTLHLRQYLPSLTEDEFELLLHYSIAGVNPSSFASINNDWQSSSARSIRERELRCACAWIHTFPEKIDDIGMSMEAYYYKILRDASTTTKEGSSLAIHRGILFRDCVRVSCPLLSRWVDSPESSVNGNQVSPDAFLNAYLVKKGLSMEGMESYWNLVDAPSLVEYNTEDDALKACRKERTPLCILGSTTLPSADALKELRHATGLLVDINGGKFVVGTMPSMLDAACTLSLMQASAPEASLMALVQAFAINSEQQRETYMAFSPSDYAYLPQCGILCVANDLPYNNVKGNAIELQSRTNPIIVAAAKRGERLYAGIAVLLFKCSSAPEDVQQVATALVAQLAPGRLPPAPTPGEIQSLLSTPFRNLPALASEVMKKVEEKRTKDIQKNATPLPLPLSRLFAIVSVIDVVGKRTRAGNDAGGSAATFTPLDGASANELIDWVASPPLAEHAANLACLRVIISVATGSDVDGGSLAAALTHLSEKLKIGTTLLLDSSFSTALQYFSSDSADTHGIVAKGVLPLLTKFGALLEGKQLWAYEVAHIARLHRYKNRAPALVELFRDVLSNYSATTPAGVLAPPAAPVDEWLSRLQQFSHDRSVHHLKVACSTCLGLNVSDKSWNLVQQYIKLQSSSGKVRKSAIESTFSANVSTIPQEEIKQLVSRLKTKPLFIPLADSLEEQLSGDPNTTLDKLSEKLVQNIRQVIIERLHMSNSDIAYVLTYVCALLSGLVTFVLLGILAFSNGSTFSSLIGVAFPAAGGSFSQYDTTSLLNTLTEKAKETLSDFSDGSDEGAAKLKVD